VIVRDFLKVRERVWERFETVNVRRRKGPAISADALASMCPQVKNDRMIWPHELRLIAHRVAVWKNIDAKQEHGAA
jgi:hypothetical protein